MPRGSAVSTASATTGALGRILLGAPAARSKLSRISLKTLLERKRRELVVAARLLGLEGLGKLRKDELAERVREALTKLPSSEGARRPGRPAGAPRRSPARGRVAPAAPGGTRERKRPGGEAGAPGGGDGGDGETGALAKFDLGSRQRQATVRHHIPWDYGQNRVTAMVVDPERMHAYWEVRDDAIESARTLLGAGGEEAWLNLRVYDVTGRIFDGTNAHAHFDTRVERGDRQWFFTIGKPTSTHCVEIGMLSPEGTFRKIARSGRVDFPRAEPAAPGPVEWLSVHEITAEVGAPVPGAAHPHLEPPEAASAAPAAVERPGAEGRTEGEYWVVNEFGSLGEWAILSGWEGHDFLRSEWIGGHGRIEWSGGSQRFEWVGPVVRTSWEAGPFPIPVEAPGLVEERHEGPVLVHKLGEQTRIVYGPWQVVIRGIGARAEGRVLATWEVRKSWVTRVGFEVVAGKLRWEALGAPDVAMGTPGASERLQPGASERRWLAGSEVRLAGASEVFRAGASDLRYLGASEALFGGASETRSRGASERRWLGASETLVSGASERTRVGASETPRRGASERLHAGASERRLGGASESRFPGASEKAAKEGVYPEPGRAPRKG